MVSRAMPDGYGCGRQPTRSVRPAPCVLDCQIVAPGINVKVTDPLPADPTLGGMPRLAAFQLHRA